MSISLKIWVIKASRADKPKTLKKGNPIHLDIVISTCSRSINACWNLPAIGWGGFAQSKFPSDCERGRISGISSWSFCFRAASRPCGNARCETCIRFIFIYRRSAFFGISDTVHACYKSSLLRLTLSFTGRCLTISIAFFLRHVLCIFYEGFNHWGRHRSHWKKEGQMEVS